MKPLSGVKVLVTRDSAQSGSLREKLVRHGAETVGVPTIKISDPPDRRAFDEAAARLPEFDWIIFSSVNAVEKTAAGLSEMKIDTKPLRNIKIATVGDQTAKAVLTAGWKTDLVPDKFQAENLLQKLMKNELSGKKIWIPGALKARNLLPVELSKAGAEVAATPIYQNIIPFENREILRRTLDEKDIDWITFTSSSTVNNFFDILGYVLRQSQLPKLASIGSITTKTLNKFSLSPAFTADPQNLEGLCLGILDREKKQNDR